MRALLLGLFVGAGVVAIIACGAGTVTVPGDDAGDAGGGSAGAGGSGGSGGGGGGGGSGGSQQCQEMMGEYATLRAAATKCCATCNVTQCDVLVDDVCCPFSATSANADAIAQFRSFLPRYVKACGNFNCPAIACNGKPSLTCTSMGVCQE